MTKASAANGRDAMSRGALTGDDPKFSSARPFGAKGAAWLAWALAGLSMAMFVAGLALYAAVLSEQNSSSWGADGIGTQLIFAPFLAFSVVGALIVSRHPKNPVGWICAADGFVWMLAILTGPYTLYGLANPGAIPYPVTASALTTWLWVPAVGLLGIYLPLLFPDGRFSGRWRYLAWFAGAVILCLSVAFVFEPGPLQGLPGVRNPFGVEWFRRIEDAGIFVVAMLPLCILASAASLIACFRRSGHEARQQIKWLALAVSLVGLAYLGTIAATLLFAPGSLGPASRTPAWLSVLQNVVLMSYAVVPVAVGVAVLKHRLFDVDVVINRALVYGALTASIVVVYVVVVGYLGALFRVDRNPAISLAATGLVAFLFAPLRGRLQRAVDRLMYGQRDDPYAVISHLGRRLEATLAPEAVLPTIVETLRETLRLPYAAISVGREDAGITASAGRPVERPLRLPLSYQNEPVGELLLGPRTGEEGFSATDRRLLSDLALQAGVAAHAVRLNSDLRRSRERLVTAREEERRRLRRDLHDGLGSQLAGLNVQAGLLRRLIPADPTAADRLAAELRSELKAAITDIRRLVYDLRPPALDDLGLAEALDRLASRYEGGSTVRVETPPTMPRLPAAVEVAVYRISQEALANVTRHANARTCLVRLCVADAVELEVVDDGIGLSAGHRAGVGLHSMRERAEELGGTCAIGEAPGGGTRVFVRMPLTED